MFHEKNAGSKKNIIRNEIILISVILTITFYLSAYVLTMNIHGDAFIHTFYAKEIVGNQNLITHQPYRVLDVKDGDIIYAPIPYPLIYHTMLSILYILGGELLLKLSSPLFAAFTVLVVYLILRDVNKYLGLFAGFLGVILSSHRFIMVPLMEQYLIPEALFAILFTYKFYKTSKNTNAILAGFFIGLVMAIKQQGLVLGFGLILFILLSFLFKKKFMSNISAKHLLFIFSLALLVPLVPLYDQIERTGTIGYSPGQARLPDFIPFSSYINENILKSKFPINEEGQDWMNNIIGYRLKQISILDTYKQYALFPIYYNRWMDYNGQIYILMFSVFFFLGSIYIFKRKTIIFYLIFFTFLLSFLTSWICHVHIYKYQQLGIISFAILIVAGIFNCVHYLKLRRFGRILVPIFIMSLIVILSSSWVTYVHSSLWMKEGRQSDIYLNAYFKLGEYVKKNTPEDAIFLAAETNFIYFAKRNSIWVSMGGGGKIPTILQSSEPEVALKWLKYYNISYIVINLDQTKRKGLYDYFPQGGLLDYINDSKYFEKEYTSENGRLILYKVVYNDK